jgi:hypothetical protein
MGAMGHELKIMEYQMKVYWPEFLPRKTPISMVLV